MKNSIKIIMCVMIFGLLYKLSVTPKTMMPYDDRGLFSFSFAVAIHFLIIACLFSAAVTISAHLYATSIPANAKSHGLSIVIVKISKPITAILGGVFLLALFASSIDFIGALLTGFM